MSVLNLKAKVWYHRRGWQLHNIKPHLKHYREILDASHQKPSFQSAAVVEGGRSGRMEIMAENIYKGRGGLSSAVLMSASHQEAYLARPAQYCQSTDIDGYSKEYIRIDAQRTREIEEILGAANEARRQSPLSHWHHGVTSMRARSGGTPVLP